jgi:lipopolysaccharide transport system permease protein
MSRSIARSLLVGTRALASNRELVHQLTARDIAMRYKNSVLGLVWVLAQPLIQLALYGFVFETVLRSRWGLKLGNGSEAPFGLVLFVGILLHAMLADTLVRAPFLVVSNPSYVKRVVFPLDILPLVNVCSALVTTLAGFAMILVATFWFAGTLPVSVLLIPLPITCLALLTLGVGWLLAALGVFFRDLAQLTTNLASVLLFTAPICFPATMVPERIRWLLDINPLTIPVECTRQMIFGPSFEQWPLLGAYALSSALIAALGYLVFTKIRPGFADAL